MKVLINGANGFVGKNLQLHLSQRKDIEVVLFTRAQSVLDLPTLVRGVGCVFHLAGINRPQDPAEFVIGNVALTHALADAVAEVSLRTGRKVPVVYTSSTQAVLDNPYGRSKRAAEDLLFTLQLTHGVPLHVFRLPNVFGMWSKPNYNSVVATFCHHIARDLPITVNDPAAPITLVYVEDLIARFVQIIDAADSAQADNAFAAVAPQYTITVGDLAHTIQSFKDSRQTLVTERVGTGLKRALYSTYVSHLPPESFAYSVPMHCDKRGVFVEMLKTPDCGQFSFFTAHPGITRGGHYHHTKTEKFLVIKGEARFKFRHMQTGEMYELVTRGSKAEIVETVPGWTHDITNIGEDEMVVMLWANEVFDRLKPDTYSCPL